VSAATHEPVAASENPTFVRNSFFSVIAGVMSSVAGFASGIIVARILGVSGTGTIAMALWLVFAAVTLCDWGLTGALARFLPPARGNAVETRQVTTYLVWAFWASVATGLVLLAGAMALWWPEAFTMEAWHGQHGMLSFGLIAFCFIIHMANSFGYHYLRGVERFGNIASYSISGSVAQIGIVLVGSLLFGPSGAMIAYILGSVPLAIVTFRLAIRGRPIRGEYRRKVTRYSAMLWIAGLLSPLLWTRVDLILVERIGGLNAAGLFTAAAAFSALLIQLCVMLCGAVLPHLSAGEDSARKAASSAALKAVLFLLMPMVFGTAAIAPRLIPLVYGPEFATAGLPAVILALAAGGSVITIALSNVLNALDQNAKLVIGGATGCVLTIVLGLILIPIYGIMGAAVARFGAQGTVAVITLYQLNQAQPGTVAWAWFRPIAVASIWCALTAAGILYVWPSDFALILAIPAGGIVYLTICRLLLKLDEADIRLLGLKPSSGAGKAASMMTKLMRA